MSIPKLVLWTRNRFKGVIFSDPAGVISTLSIGVSQVIEEEAAKVYAYGKGANDLSRKNVLRSDRATLQAELVVAVKSKLSQIVDQVKPTNMLVLCVDGVVPMARMFHEKAKRYMNTATDSSTAKMEVRGMDLTSKIDRSSFTPGTMMMRTLDLKIRQWIEDRKSVHPVRVVYYSHLTPETAVAKIMNLMRDEDVETQGYHMIYSSDEEAILSAMVAPVKRVEVMREYIQKKKAGVMRMTKYVSIDNLRSSIHEYMGTRPTSVHDFTVLMSFMGNPYLPRCPSLGVSIVNIRSAETSVKGIDDLVDAYKAIGSSLIDEKTGDINWDAMLKLMIELSSREYAMLSSQVNGNPRPGSVIADSTRSVSIESSLPISELRSRKKVVKSLDKGSYRGNWYSNALGPKNTSDFLAIANGILDSSRRQLYGPRKDDIVYMCVEYLQGVAWINNYYTLGSGGVNLHWKYNRYHAPMFQDLASTVKGLGVIDGYDSVPTAKIPNALHMLLAVVPPTSAYLLPQTVSHLVTNIYKSPISYQYPIGFGIDYNASKGVPLIPMPSISELISSIDLVTLIPEEINLFSAVPGVDISVRGSETSVVKLQARIATATRRGRVSRRSKGKGPISRYPERITQSTTKTGRDKPSLVPRPSRTKAPPKVTQKRYTKLPRSVPRSRTPTEMNSLQEITQMFAEPARGTIPPPSSQIKLTVTPVSGGGITNLEPIEL